MNSSHCYLVIMAGGSGTRFWPKSTSRRPKQFLKFGTHSETLLVQTYRRFESIVPEGQSIVVTTELLGQEVKNQLPDVQVLAEPQGRNTAPCVYWAAREIYDRDPEGIMLVMPADHSIPQVDRFVETVQAAVQWATTHPDLVTLGVFPTRPEVGYGYLKVTPSNGPSAAKVEAFVEKPNRSRAEEFVRSGNYLWNGGMFVWGVRSILDAYDQWMPEMKKIWDEAGGKVHEAYPSLTATSIDFGIMEKAKNVVTFKLDCGWDDLGSWTSLENLAPALNAVHAAGVVVGGELVAIDSSGLIVDMPGHLVATLGVKDLVIVESGDSILIADKSRAQDIRQVVDQVKKVRPELA